MYILTLIFLIFACERVDPEPSSAGKNPAVEKKINYNYYYKNNKVFYGDAQNGPEYELQDADVDSFTPINRSYAKDKNSVFYGYTKLVDADVSTFKTLDYFLYSQDSRYIYWKHEKIESIDIGSFQTLSCGYIKDQAKVFWRNKQLDVSVLSSFEFHSIELRYPSEDGVYLKKSVAPIEYCYFHDGDFFYYEDKKFESIP